MLPLTAITAPAPDGPDFSAGRAFAVAIALFSNDATPTGPRPLERKKGHVIWWGHPVQLLESEEAVDKARTSYVGNAEARFDEITTILEGLWNQKNQGRSQG